MEKERYKSAKQSKTTQSHIVFSGYTNGVGRLFGGQLVAWMDVVAAVVARRHAESEVTTASIEKMDFAAPAHKNDTVLLEGELISVGNSSMKIRVRAYVETLACQRKQISEALFTLVAIDAEGKPQRVPRLLA
jgi:acyl-CoA hydrolase